MLKFIKSLYYVTHSQENLHCQMSLLSVTFCQNMRQNVKIVFQKSGFFDFLYDNEKKLKIAQIHLNNHYLRILYVIALFSFIVSSQGTTNDETKKYISGSHAQVLLHVRHNVVL